MNRNYSVTSIILFGIFSHGYSQSGQLDLTFNNTGKAITSIENQSLEGNAVIIQPDGKILVSGIATSANAKKDFAIVRFKANGDLDESFNSTGKLTIDFSGNNDYCYDIALQSDGKILLTGIIALNNLPRKAVLVRLNNDGSLDLPFGNNGISVNNFDNRSEDSRSILIQKDGKIITTGMVTTQAFITECALIRYNEDGTLDQNFGKSGIVTANVPDGYNSSFGIQQPDGKIITGGFLLANNTDIFMLRFNADGTLDNSFGINGKVQTDFNNEEEFAYEISLQSDNKIVLVVGIRNSGGTDFGIVRYNVDGSLDSTFGINGKVITDFSFNSNTAHDIAIQEDQKIVLAGFLGTTPKHDFALARYNSTGLLDMEFGINGKVVTDFGNDDLAFAMTLQPDKKIVVVGHTINTLKIGDFAISRYLSGLELVNTQSTTIQINNLLLYPNPTFNKAILEYILSKDHILNISLFDLSGKLIKNYAEMVNRPKGLNQESLLFNPDIKPGNYFLLIASKDSQSGINLTIR